MYRKYNDYLNLSHLVVVIYKKRILLRNLAIFNQYLFKNIL